MALKKDSNHVFPFSQTVIKQMINHMREKIVSWNISGASPTRKVGRRGMKSKATVDFAVMKDTSASKS